MAMSDGWGKELITSQQAGKCTHPSADLVLHSRLPHTALRLVIEDHDWVVSRCKADGEGQQRNKRQCPRAAHVVQAEGNFVRDGAERTITGKRSAVLLSHGIAGIYLQLCWHQFARTIGTRAPAVCCGC